MEKKEKEYYQKTTYEKANELAVKTGKLLTSPRAFMLSSEVKELLQCFADLSVELSEKIEEIEVKQQ